jgi:hypothetical protein
MAHIMRRRRRLDVRAELGWFLGILGATGLAISQPVLDVFGKSPETFIFRGADATDLLLFGLGIALAPALGVWAVGLTVGVVWPRWRHVAHAASVGGLVALMVAQLIASLPTAVVAIAAAVVIVAVTELVARVSAFRLWLQLLAILPAVSLVTFTTSSQAAEVVRGGELEEADAVASTTAEVAPIVLIVVDELPTSSIIDSSGAIDAVRFPNFARLAADSTWYRNTTAVSGYTRSAVPSIFTGKLPDDSAPYFANHPDSIFRLVAGTHDLVVEEAITRLCPTSACGERPTAPGQPDGAATSTADLGALYSDALDVWTDRLADRESAADLLAEFEEATASSEPSVAFEADASSLASGTASDVVPLVQSERIEAFTDAIRPGERPLAAVVHLVLPHSPWRHLPDGREYVEPSEAGGVKGALFPDPWTAALQRQRHLLQATYTDALVGQVLDRLEEQGVYDDAVVALVADHGVSFQLNQIMRVFTPASTHEILWVPFIVKAPRQDEAIVDDRNLETVDVMPTIADLAGLEVPWAIDGVAASDDAAIAARGGTKRFRRFTNPLEPRPPSSHEVDAAEGFARMLADVFPPIAAGDDPVRALYQLSGRGDLYGRAYEPTAEDTSRAPAVDDVAALRSTGAAVLALSGALEGSSGVTHVVAAVDGRIVAISPIIDRKDGRPGFALLLPASGTVDVADVRLGLVGGAGGADLTDTGPLQG